MADIGVSTLHDVIRVLRWLIANLFKLIGSVIKHFVNKNNNAPKQ